MKYFIYEDDIQQAARLFEKKSVPYDEDVSNFSKVVVELLPLKTYRTQPNFMHKHVFSAKEEIIDEYFYDDYRFKEDVTELLCDMFNCDNFRKHFNIYDNFKYAIRIYSQNVLIHSPLFRDAHMICKK